jgi:crotonobetainyl-CoA:carnitine CoA-transferase CaiB-like acyl-CoA transferase
VIKVERPGRGDDARAWGPPFVDGTSAWFASANRNKQSLVLNLRVPEGREALLRLLDNAEVFLQNMNPAKLERMGIDHATLRSRNPRLIYCAMSGFGLTGPDSDLPGYDLVAQARSGLMSVTGEKGRSPQRVSTALSDIVTGMSAAIAVNAALVRQARTGEGDVIDVSLLDTDLALMAPRIAAYRAGEPEPAPSGGTDWRCTSPLRRRTAPSSSRSATTGCGSASAPPSTCPPYSPTPGWATTRVGGPAVARSPARLPIGCRRARPPSGCGCWPPPMCPHHSSRPLRRSSRTRR